MEYSLRIFTVKNKKLIVVMLKFEAFTKCQQRTTNNEQLKNGYKIIKSDRKRFSSFQ